MSDARSFFDTIRHYYLTIGHLNLVLSLNELKYSKPEFQFNLSTNGVTYIFYVHLYQRTFSSLSVRSCHTFILRRFPTSEDSSSIQSIPNLTLSVFVIIPKSMLLSKQMSKIYHFIDHDERFSWQRKQQCLSFTSKQS
jgi:hypothetical protein